MSNTDPTITVEVHGLQEGAIVPILLGQNPFILIEPTPSEEVANGEEIPPALRMVVGGFTRDEYEIVQTILDLCSHVLQPEHGEGCPMSHVPDPTV